MSSAPCGKCGKPTRALRRQFYDYPAGVGGYYHRRCWFGRKAPASMSAKKAEPERCVRCGAVIGPRFSNIEEDYEDHRVKTGCDGGTGWTAKDCANYCTPSFPHQSCAATGRPCNLGGGG